MVKTEHIGGGIHDGAEYDLEFEHSYDFENMTQEELLALGAFSGKDIINNEDVEFETFDSELFDAAIESSKYDGQDDYFEEEEHEHEGEDEEFEGGDVEAPTEEPEEFYDYVDVLSGKVFEEKEGVEEADGAAGEEEAVEDWPSDKTILHEFYD